MKEIKNIINEEISNFLSSNFTFDQIKADEGEWNAQFKIYTDGGMRMYVITPYFMTIRPFRKDTPSGNLYSYGRERRFGITKGMNVERTDEENFYKAVNVLINRQNKSNVR